MVKKTAFSRFQKIIRDYYKKNRRDLPWRNTKDPYHILVSEMMLQQTQVSRVLAKYQEFLSKFARLKDLADADFKDVLTVWKGLGYNRRASYLHELSKKVIKEHKGGIPCDFEVLDTFPGIGMNTAGSILVFAFNIPTIFIETNIRRVFIHFFFPKRTKISDREIFPLIEKTLDKKHPKEWYFALMDYGAMLGKLSKNPNHKSRHYKKQSPFEGSNRELRGFIIKYLLSHPHTTEDLTEMIGREKNLIEKNLSGLLQEKLIQRNGKTYFI